MCVCACRQNAAHLKMLIKKAGKGSQHGVFSAALSGRMRLQLPDDGADCVWVSVCLCVKQWRQTELKC